MPSKDYDWRSNIKKKGFPNDGDLRTNKKYLEDRSKLFTAHGNGWWWFPSKVFHKEFLRSIKEAKDE